MLIVAHWSRISELLAMPLLRSTQCDSVRNALIAPAVGVAEIFPSYDYSPAKML
jgi:hypothetical protein